jgi:hypothetical protein
MKRTNRRLWLALAIGTSIFAQTRQETEDQTNVVYQAEIKEGKVLKYKIDLLSRDAFSTKPYPKDKPAAPKDVAPERIHPVLQKWLAEKDPKSLKP